MSAKPISIDKQQKIVEMRKQGYKTKEISKEVGVSAGAVSKYGRGDFKKTQPISAIPVRDTPVSAETQSIRYTPVKNQYMPETRYNFGGIPVDDDITIQDADAIIQARQGIPVPPIPPKDITLEQFIIKIKKQSADINEKQSADIAEKRKQDEKETEKRQKQAERRQKQRKAGQDHQAFMNNLHNHKMKNLAERRMKNSEPLVFFPEEPKMTDGLKKAYDDCSNTERELLRYEWNVEHKTPIIKEVLFGGLNLIQQLSEAWRIVKESKKQEVNPPKQVKLQPRSKTSKIETA